MEALDVDARSPAPFAVFAQLDPGDVADLVAGGLPRPDAVALDLGGDAGFLIAQRIDHVANALFAAPALVVQTRVHDQTRGAEHQGLQVADLAKGIVLI